MRKRFFGVLTAVAAAVILGGCSGDTVMVNGSGAEIFEAGVKVELPEGWKIFTGDDIYKITYSRNPDGYASAEELKEDIEGNGERYIIYAESPDEDALALFSMQTMESSPNEELTVESLARAAHDNTVFEYRLNEYYTESSFSGENMNGVSGWLSDIKVFKEPDGEAVCEQREFVFEKDKNAYSFRMFTQGLVNEQTRNFTISAI